MSGRAAESGVAILAVDTDRPMGTIDKNIYGHFLEHINHSVVDGLFAEQVRGQGFEGILDDFVRRLGATEPVSALSTSLNATDYLRICA